MKIIIMMIFDKVMTCLAKMLQSHELVLSVDQLVVKTKNDYH